MCLTSYRQYGGVRFETRYSDYQCREGGRREREEGKKEGRMLVSYMEERV